MKSYRRRRRRLVRQLYEKEESRRNRWNLHGSLDVRKEGSKKRAAGNYETSLEGESNFKRVENERDI